MQESKLTVNGIDKLFGKMDSIIVQLSSVVFKYKNNQHFYPCQISDGYCKTKCCIIESNYDQSNPKLIDNTIIKITKSNAQKSKQHQSWVIIVEGYEIIYLNIKKQIGNPILYDDYCKNGKNNPMGDNVILKEYVILDAPNKANQKFQVDQFLDDTKDQVDNSKANSKPIQQNNIKKNISDNSNRSSSNNNQSKLNFGVKNQNKTVKNQENSGYSNQNSKNNPIVKVQSNNIPKPKYQPIQPVQKKLLLTNQSVKTHQKKHNTQFNDIKSLYIGMENWSILARILFIYPIKTIMTKKGTQSTILVIQIGDASQSIQCTAFGQMAAKYQNTLKEDSVYQISNGTVIQSSFLGKHQLKITLNQMTKINLKQDDPNVPYIEDFALNIKRLTQAPLQEQFTVICLVKDTEEVEQLISKAGKQLKKKKLFLLDPEEKIQVQAVIWGQRAYQRFQKYPYVIKGIQTGQFNNNRQYTIRQSYIARPLKQHNFRKYIKEIDNMQTTVLNSYSNKKGSTLCDLQQLTNAIDDDKNVWTDAFCYFVAIKQSTKNFYVSCPFCKKKVIDEQSATCISCNKFYDKAKYRYILNINVTDQYQSIWITAYDEIGEKILGISAQEYATLNEEETQQVIKKIRYKQFKFRLLTKNETYNNQVRKKTSVIRIMDINYSQQTKLLTDKLNELFKK